MNVVEKEQYQVWMLRKVQKGIEHCYYQTLRDVLKVEGDKMMKVVANYWKVKFKLQEIR